MPSRNYELAKKYVTSLDKDPTDGALFTKIADIYAMLAVVDQLQTFNTQLSELQAEIDDLNNALDRISDILLGARTADAASEEPHPRFTM